MERKLPSTLSTSFNPNLHQSHSSTGTTIVSNGNQSPPPTPTGTTGQSTSQHKRSLSTSNCTSPPTLTSSFPMLKTQNVKPSITREIQLDQLDESFDSSFHVGNLIIVSNRLPMTITRKKETCSNGGGGGGDHFQYQKSSGGLVTALTGMNMDFTWIGWTGSEVSDANDQNILKRDLLEGFNQFPVFLEKEEATLYYDGFCNGVLWPIFHYMYEKNVTYKQEEWDAYKKVNEKFADAVLSVYKENDCVWIHDYHLMLLPEILRKKRPDMNIAFFLHIPFPSSEIYRILPVRSQLLEGLLSSNLVAFHTFDFARHFLSSCTRTLGADTTPRGLFSASSGLNVSVHSLPIGIDPHVFRRELDSEQCQKILAEFKTEKYKGKKIVLGIDRLDYTKGVQLKFAAFERFLTNFPHRAQDTVLIQVGVPTRPNVVEYQELLSDVNETTGRINSTFGSLNNGFPVHFFYKSVNMSELCALYALADICIITSIRDGMNLVSSEYVICQDEALRLGLRENVGVLILSEFAGAARSLGGSLIINPWDLEQTMKSIADGLDMKSSERMVRHRFNNSIVMRNTAAQWGRDFMQEFESACRNQKDPTLFNRLSVKGLPVLKYETMINDYSNSISSCSGGDGGSGSGGKRLFLFDYDGTLVKLNKFPSLALPSERLLQILENLTSDPNNMVYIITGRSEEQMNEFVGNIKGLGLACEHGFYCRHPNQTEYSTCLYNIDPESLAWIQMVKPILEHVTSRTPGSFTEVKNSSLVFHYKNADPDYGEWSANELKLHLEMSFNSQPLEIIRGRNKVLEIRPQSVSKGACTRKLLERGDYSFIFCCGDDNTDESMFEEVEKHSKKNLFATTTQQPMSPLQSFGSPAFSSHSPLLHSTTTSSTTTPQSPRFSPAIAGYSSRNFANITPKTVYSAIVTKGAEKIASKARYQIRGVDGLLDLLEQLNENHAK